MIFHRLKLDVLQLILKLAFGTSLFSAEFLPQARHLCQQLKSQFHVYGTVLHRGTHLLGTWIVYLNTTAAFSLSFPTCPIVLAPILATLMQYIRAPPLVVAIDYNEYAAGHANVAAKLGVSSAFALGAFPLFCRTCPIAQFQAPLHDWLAPRALRQQELLNAFSSSSFRWFLWNSFASAAAHVHELTGGMSPACSCKVPDIAFDGSIEYWGPLWEVLEDSLPMLEDFLENLWWALLGCYLVLPGEGILKSLLQQQNEMMEYRQREGLPSSNSSSSRSSQNPATGPGCFWFVDRVPARLPKCQGLGPEEVMGEHVVTLQQLQLVVNMLLLLWPKGTAAATAGAAAGAAAGAEGAAAPAPTPLAPGAAAAAGTRRAADGEAVRGKVQETEEGSTGFRRETEGAAAAREAAGTASAAAAGPSRHRSQQAAAGALSDGQGGPALPPAAGAAATGGAAGEAAGTASAAAAGPLRHMSQQAAAGALSDGQGGPALPPAAGAAATGGAAGASSSITPSAGRLPALSSEPACTGALLLLAAMLQQAPAEAKQQLMKAEEGNLLLQLLYRVSQDQQDLMALNTVKVKTSLDGVLDTVAPGGCITL